MFNDRAEHNVFSGDVGGNKAGATQRMLDEVFPALQNTVSEKFSDQDSKPSVTQSKREKVEFGYDVNAFFVEMDRSEDGQVTIPELDFENQKRDSRIIIALDVFQAWLFDSIDSRELRRVYRNFDLIAGEDQKISKEDLQAFREEEASLPPLARETDINGDLVVEDWEVSSALRRSDDFNHYDTILQVQQDFDKISGEDGMITGNEWSVYFDNRRLP